MSYAKNIKTLEEIKETVKTASSEISCGCNKEHGNLLPINEKELYDFKSRALDDIYSNYRAILDYGNPFEYERKLIENRIAFLNDFKHMIENVSITSNDSISVEVTFIYENEDTTTYKTDAPIFNIFSDDIKVGYDVYGVLLTKFINEISAFERNPNVLFKFFMIPPKKFLGTILIRILLDNG